MPIKVTYNASPVILGRLGFQTGQGQRADDLRKFQVQQDQRQQQIDLQRLSIGLRAFDASERRGIQQDQFSAGLLQRQFQQQSQQEFSAQQQTERLEAGQFQQELQATNQERRELKDAERDLVLRLPMEAQKKYAQFQSAMVRIRSDSSIRPEEATRLIGDLQQRSDTLIETTNTLRPEDPSLADMIKTNIMVVDRMTMEPPEPGTDPVDIGHIVMKDGNPEWMRNSVTPKDRSQAENTKFILDAWDKAGRNATGTSGTSGTDANQDERREEFNMIMRSMGMGDLLPPEGPSVFERIGDVAGSLIGAFKDRTVKQAAATTAIRRRNAEQAIEVIDKAETVEGLINAATRILSGRDFAPADEVFLATRTINAMRPIVEAAQAEGGSEKELDKLRRLANRLGLIISRLQEDQ